MPPDLRKYLHHTGRIPAIQHVMWGFGDADSTRGRGVLLPAHYLFLKPNTTPDQVGTGFPKVTR